MGQGHIVAACLLNLVPVTRNTFVTKRCTYFLLHRTMTLHYFVSFDIFVVGMANKCDLICLERCEMECHLSIMRSFTVY